MQGLVIENISNLYRIKCNEKIYESSARGRLKNEQCSPVVGDIVEFEIVDNDKNIAIIEKIITRRNYIKRPKLANITKIILVVSSKEPKPDLYMLDKQLAFAEKLKINVLIVLNKIDLDKKEMFKEIKEVYEKVGYKVIVTDAKLGIGVQELKLELKNEICAFSGNSGVGKSTLINSIFKREVSEEGLISKKNKRGKNTTTTSKIYEVEKNSYIVDTPRLFKF